MKKNIEMTLLYENGYGKLFINKEYHLVDIEAENLEEFLKNLGSAAEILGEEVVCNKDESLRKDFMETQIAILAFQTCTIIHKHIMEWNPMMAALNQLNQIAEEEGIPDDPLDRALFMMKTLSGIRE